MRRRQTRVGTHRLAVRVRTVARGRMAVPKRVRAQYALSVDHVRIDRVQASVARRHLAMPPGVTIVDPVVQTVQMLIENHSVFLLFVLEEQRHDAGELPAGTSGSPRGVEIKMAAGTNGLSRVAGDLSIHHRSIARRGRNATRRTADRLRSSCSR